MLDRKQEFHTQASEEFLSHIDKALDAFGPTVKSVVYFRFQQEHGLRREEIEERPELFVETIDKLFGIGARTLKSSIDREMRLAVAPIQLKQSDTVSILRDASRYLCRPPIS